MQKCFVETDGNYLWTPSQTILGCKTNVQIVSTTSGTLLSASTISECLLHATYCCWFLMNHLFSVTRSYVVRKKPNYPNILIYYFNIKRNIFEIIQKLSGLHTRIFLLFFSFHLGSLTFPLLWVCRVENVNTPFLELMQCFISKESERILIGKTTIPKICITRDWNILLAYEIIVSFSPLPHI